MPFSYAITIGRAHRHDSILAPYNSSIYVNHISSNNIRAEVLKATASKHSLPRIRIPSERVHNSSAHVRLSCGTRGIGAGEARPSLAPGNGVTGMPKDGGNSPRARKKGGARAYARLTKADRLSIERSLDRNESCKAMACDLGRPVFRQPIVSQNSIRSFHTSA